jgi:hypothetical protein
MLTLSEVEGEESPALLKIALSAAIDPGHHFRTPRKTKGTLPARPAFLSVYDSGANN